jgi:V-type H+-transporting ATPase subunit a
MFGDIGHGLTLFAFGLYLIFGKDQINHSILKMLLPHRYLFTLMGFFGAYCGFIYNDYLSISLNLWGSCYSLEGVTSTNPIPRISSDCVYPFGLDPVWSVS